MKNKEYKFGYHFLNQDNRLNYTDYRKVSIGKWYEAGGYNSRFYKNKPIICSFGMHACQNFFGALNFYRNFYEKNNQLCYVKVEGPFDFSEPGDDVEKFCGMRRKIVWKLSPEDTIILIKRVLRRTRLSSSLFFRSCGIYSLCRTFGNVEKKINNAFEKEIVAFKPSHVYGSEL